MQEFLESIPAGLLVLVVGGIVGLESIGLPLPGETVLITGTLIAEKTGISLWWLFLAAALGAVIGDNIGYLIGHLVGFRVLEWARRKLPKVFSTESIVAAARMMYRYGPWAIFMARFVALLRIFAGPLAGALRMPYRSFFIANLAGGVVWAGAVVWLTATVGHAVALLIHQYSWAFFALAVALTVFAVVVLVRQRRERKKNPREGLTPEQQAMPLRELLALVAEQTPPLGAGRARR